MEAPSVRTKRDSSGKGQHSSPVHTPIIATHPSDSSRILLGLMTLARRADENRDDPTLDSLSGAISRNVLRSLLTALHHRDHNTILHSRRVALLCVGIGKYLGWNENQLKMLEVAA